MFWQEVWNRVMNTNPGLWDICLRLACAMLVGLVIGTEREYTHRPAGMRTHILVALGACVVSITGEIIFNHYNSLGAFPDPARLSAQVITGVVSGMLKRSLTAATITVLKAKCFYRASICQTR